MEHVIAVGQHSCHLPLLQDAKADGALHGISGFPVGEIREGGDGGGIEPGRLPPIVGGSSGPQAPDEKVAGADDDEVEEDEDAEGDADELQDGVQIAAGGSVSHGSAAMVGHTAYGWMRR